GVDSDRGVGGKYLKHNSHFYHGQRVERNFYTNVIWKVTKEHTLYNSELSGTRLHQHNLTVVSHTMESTVTGVSEENTSNTTVTSTTDNELKETSKRKSQEDEEPEKSSRLKRRRGGGGKKQLRPGEQYIPLPQKRNPGVSFSKDTFYEMTYYFEGGLRKVHSYYFDFNIYCKGRWIGKSLLENNGRNTVHCHEPPVVRRPLEILEDNGEVLVVDKPSSMPVHPCGRFHHNTVIFILGKNRAYVAFILCTGWIASRLGCCSSPALWKCPKNVLVWRRSTSVEWRGFPEGEIICEEPILVFSFKCAASLSRPHSPDPRPPPGYPILNDPIYGSSAWGPDRAKGGLVGMSDHDLLKAILEEHHLKANLNLLDIPDEGIGQVSNARSDVNGKDAQTPQPELLPQVCNSVSRDCKLNDVEQSANQVHSSPATPGALPRPSEENGDQTKSTESSHSASTNTRDPLCNLFTICLNVAPLHISPGTQPTELDVIREN
ncbi:unnamed protein product, partial [Coregonus sp. 'balchen']